MKELRRFCKRMKMKVNVGENKLLKSSLSGEQEPLGVRQVGGTRGGELIQILDNYGVCGWRYGNRTET